MFNRVVDGFLGKAEEMVLSGAVADDGFVVALDDAGNDEKFFDSRRELAQRTSKYLALKGHASAL